MFVCSVILGVAGAASVIAVTGSVIAGIVALKFLWILLPFLGYRILGKRQSKANRPGPFILLEDGFLTIPQHGKSDLGLDLQDVVLCAFVLEVWLRAFTQDDGTVVKSNLRQRFAVLQLQQPESVVQFMAELGTKDKIPNLPRLHRVPPMAEGCQLESIDIWLEDFNDFLATLRSSGMREVEAKL